MSAPTLVAVGRGWTPEEAARHEVALYRHLASDKKALRVFLQKVRVVEMVRTSRQQQVVSLPADSINPQIKPAAGAGGRSSGLPGQPLAAATKPRARRRKSEAQRRKSVLKLQHKKLQTRCESAANKAGGSPPKVLARVLACCGRFIELLHPEGAQRMERLRQVEAASRERCGLEAMREALAATSAVAEPAPMDVGKASVPNLTLTHPHPPSPGSGGGAYRAALEKAPVVAQGGGDGEKTSRYGYVAARVVAQGTRAQAAGGKSVRALVHVPSHDRVVK